VVWHKAINKSNTEFFAESLGKYTVQTFCESKITSEKNRIAQVINDIPVTAVSIDD